MRVGSLGYATTQGLGYLAKAFYDHGIVTHPIIFKHRGRETQRQWYPPNALLVTPQMANFIPDVDVMLFYETPFNWNLINHCRQRGIKTVLIPMYEWTLKNWPAKPDALFCPSLLDVDYFRDEFPEGRCPFIPIPVETKHYKLRTHARRFLHNGGNIGAREHKGTRQLLEAIPHVKHPEFQITIRAQNTRALRSILDDAKINDPRLHIHSGEIPREELWDGYDVYVAPEKLNGLSLPLQESYAAGMMVMTTNRYPANTWLPIEPLIPVDKTRPASIGASYREFEECLIEPETIARCIDAWVGKDITEFSQQAELWGAEHSWDNRKWVIQRALKQLVNDEPIDV